MNDSTRATPIANNFDFPERGDKTETVNSPDQPEANSLTVLLNILTAPEEPNADNLELLCEQAERAISLGREIRFRVEKSDWKQSLRGLCTQIDFP